LVAALRRDGFPAARAQSGGRAAARRLIRVGVISDTHGLLRREAVAALRGAELIIHAGDIGRPEILEELRAIAPTVAVRGNVDRQAWAADLPAAQSVRVADATFWLLHDISRLDVDPKAAGFRAVIYGHSHSPLIAVRQGVVYLNPGSAGPRRFRLPVSVARLHVRGRTVRPEIVTLCA
jgi:putative phosphoesterase